MVVYFGQQNIRIWHKVDFSCFYRLHYSIVMSFSILDFLLFAFSHVVITSLIISNHHYIDN